MPEIQDYIYVVPISNVYLVYSPLNQISALLNHAAVSELKIQIDLISDNCGDKKSKLYTLAENILDKSSQLAENQYFKPDFIGIIPTRVCNSNCVYCDFNPQDTDNKKMSYQMAADIVDWYVDLIFKNQQNILKIHFFGGEPMMTQDVLEVVIQRARLLADKNKITPYFEITTNGQYSTEAAEFVGTYFNSVVLSFDGFANVQNLHRSLPNSNKSFNNVNNTAKIIGESHAELNLRCCVSNKNINQLPEITKWFCENFRVSIINFETLAENKNTQNSGIFKPDPIQFALQYYKSKQIAKNYGVDVNYSLDIHQDVPRITSCPVGTDVPIITPDGAINNCYLLSERWQKRGINLNFGQFISHKNHHIDYKQLKNIKKKIKTKQKCLKCFCRWSCAGGCHVDHTYPDCSAQADDICYQTRLISIFSLLSELNEYHLIDNILSNNNLIHKITNQKSYLLKDFI